MAQSKSGPVRPPILDMEANKAAGSNGKKSPDGADFVRRFVGKLPVGALIAGAAAGLFAGMVGGLALFYLLGTGGEQAASSLQGEVGAVTQQVGALATQLEATEAEARQAADALDGIAMRVDTLENAGLATKDALAGLKIPDVTLLESQVADLRELIDRLPTSGDAVGAQSAGQFAALVARLDALEARLGAQQASISGINAAINHLEAQQSAQAEAIASRAEANHTDGNSVRVPLALTGFTEALASGQPFSAELDALHAAFPDIALDAKLQAVAGAGILPPSAISAIFSDNVQAMIAAEPVDPDAGWQDGLWRKLRSLLALRQTSEAGGTSSEALLSRLERALADEDYKAAQSALGALPDPMQAAAPGLKDALELQVLAHTYLDAVRQAAIGPVSVSGTGGAE